MSHSISDSYDTLFCSVLQAFSDKKIFRHALFGFYWEIQSFQGSVSVLPCQWNARSLYILQKECHRHCRWDHCVQLHYGAADDLLLVRPYSRCSPRLSDSLLPIQPAICPPCVVELLHQKQNHCRIVQAGTDFLQYALPLESAVSEALLSLAIHTPAVGDLRTAVHLQSRGIAPSLRIPPCFFP